LLSKLKLHSLPMAASASPFSTTLGTSPGEAAGNIAMR
jgi:hypothetical protein